MTLRIAYISDERFPSVHTDTQQVIKTIDALGRQGARVDFIQPRLLRHLTLSRSRVHERICDYYHVEGRFTVKDMLLIPGSDLRVEKISHGLFAPLKARMGSYDFVYSRNLLPLRLSALLRLPVLFETYRALPLTNANSWRVVKGALGHPRFLGISTHSEYSRQVMIDHGAPPHMVEAVPNGFDPADFPRPIAPEDARKELGLSGDRPIAVYTGHIRRDKGVHTLLDMAEADRDFQMLIVGGAKKEVEELRSTVQDRRLSNVTLTGQVPIGRVPLYLAAADALVLPPSALPLQKATVLPMKTFTYMAAGRPILAPDLPDTAGVLVDGINSVKVPPDDIRAAVSALRRLFEDRPFADQLSQRAKEDARRFTWDGRAQNLLRFVERRLAETQRR